MRITNLFARLDPECRPHVTDGGPCWCEPWVSMICYVCENPSMPDPDCWACKGRGLRDHDGGDDPSITVHRCNVCFELECHCGPGDPTVRHYEFLGGGP